jgi:sulfate-transporting ATPase
MAEKTPEKFIFYMHRMTKLYPPNKEVLKDISLSFFYGAKIGIIGPNGSGKSTLLRIMAGIDKEFQGEAWIEPGRTAGYLPQEPQLDPNLTVKENVMLAVKKKQAILDSYNEISMRFAEELSDDEMNRLMEEQGKLQDIIDAQDLWSLERNIEIAMDALRCPPGDAVVTHLSGGEKRRVALCRLLLEEPDLLLLDEPTNHLDAESVAWLERHLRDYKGSVILVTHDRYFLDNVTNWILEIDRGWMYKILYSFWKLYPSGFTFWCPVHNMIRKWGVSYRQKRISKIILEIDSYWRIVLSWIEKGEWVCLNVVTTNDFWKGPF